jgi:ribonucleoside-diphosphate reductase alpha chain
MEFKSGNTDDIPLSDNARKVLERRYLLKDEQGRVVESPHQMFQRIAEAVAEADLHYDKGEGEKQLGEEFFHLMANLDFLPNSPTLMNAGTEIGQLSACFVLPVGDSIREIFGAVKNMALIHQSGGGTGFSFSRLRPKDDVVKSTGGIASGPVSFMRVYDEATEIIKQGGRRRGANMGILRVDHPDILEFIRAKEKGGFLTNFNISVNATDRFMESVKADGKYDLINPRTGKVARTLRAKRVFDRAVKSAWKTGDPGCVFIDEINRHNPREHQSLRGTAAAPLRILQSRFNQSLHDGPG